MMKTIKDCMEITGLPYSVLRKLCLSEQIIYIRSGNKYYINLKSLLNYLGEESEQR